MNKNTHTATKKIKNIFLQESYHDSWIDYERTLYKKRMIKWDYCILTASNEEQAQAYREQIQFRLDNGFLPRETCYAVLPDPDGKRVGSGGATFNVMNYVYRHSGGFKGKRILVIHSGGDSKRVPQYSACGKLFSPVPRQLPDGRRSTLFDEFIIAMSGVAARIKDGMMVLSGDVLMLFNPLQIDFQSGGVCAVSIKENVETGKDHGVFLTDAQGNVLQFLHKQTVEILNSIGAVNENGNVDIDTGAVLMDSRVLSDLYKLIDTEDKFNAFVNERARVSFYADFLYPLAKESTLEQYYKEAPEGDFTSELFECRTKIWEKLSKHNMKMISLSPAEFIHFGTTHELLELMSERISDYSFLDWSKNVLSNQEDISYTVSNSFISDDAEINSYAYIEDSYILGKTKIGKNCVISNMLLKDEYVPDNTVLHGLKLKNGKFVVRKYEVSTNPKENNFWEREQYTEADTLTASLHGEGDILTSLCRSFNMADTRYILEWQNNLNEDIRIDNFIKAIKKRVQAYEALNVFGKLGITDNVVNKLMDTAKSSSPDVCIRIYYYLSKHAGFSLEKKEMFEAMCFESIQKSVLETALKKLKYNDKYTIKNDDVHIELPVRVNWGGGWSDTPPYCSENGGTVLNAAIKLMGRLPVRVNVRRLDTFEIVFESVDSGDKNSFTQLCEIQDNNNPFDPFAIHKAALISCGVVPLDEKEELCDILKRLGGGIYISTEVIGVPRGSGLGTSSILAGACVKGIFEFLGEQMPEDTIYRTVLCMEQIMSTGGGWQDQVGGITRGIKFITSNKGDEQELSVTVVDISGETKKELSDRFALIYTGQRRLARNILRNVIGGYLMSDEKIVDVLCRIQRVAALMKFELEKGEIDRFAALLNEHWELSRALDKGCTNTCIDQILAGIDDMICGRFISGAGGGGFLQVILKKGYTKEMLRNRLHAIFQDSGIDIWESEFI